MAQVPGQVAAAPRAASAEEAQESAAFMGEELSENYDEESAAPVDGQEVASTIVEDEGAGPPSTRVRFRGHRGAGARAAALEDRRHAVVVATKCGRWLIESAALWKETSTF